MKRRDFITLLGGAAAWPIAARAQQATLPVVGFLGPETPDVFAPRIEAFRRGLRENGQIEGRTMALAFQWAGGHYELFPIMADEFVRQKVSVLVALGTPLTVRAAKAAAATIPIVFYTGSDPVKDGLVASLNRPGGNITGISGLARGLLSKRVELLHEAVPQAKRLAVLVNPNNPSAAESEIRGMQESARAFGLDLPILEGGSADEIDAAFSRLTQMQAGGLIVASDAFLAVHATQLAELSLRHRIPAISLYPDFPAAGGLMSYGGDVIEHFRLVGNYAGRVLNGETPADLPVQQATKVELVLNMKTAKALGVTLPLTLLGRADEVIE
jgi:putative tryptophan/tyrosine transport system substrate-binding protein